MSQTPKSNKQRPAIELKPEWDQLITIQFHQGAQQELVNGERLHQWRGSARRVEFGPGGVWFPETDGVDHFVPYQHITQIWRVAIEGP